MTVQPTWLMILSSPAVETPAAAAARVAAVTGSAAAADEVAAGAAAGTAVLRGFAAGAWLKREGSRRNPSSRSSQP